MTIFFDLVNFCFTPVGFLTAVVIVFTYYVVKRILHPDKLRNIPGPMGLPIVGYFPFLGRKMHLTLTDLWKIYGDVYKLEIGSRRMVVINGQKALRQALLNKNDFGGRPDYCSYQMASKDSLVGLNDYTPQYSKTSVATQFLTVCCRIVAF